MMTVDEILEVLTAIKEGKTILYRPRGNWGTSWKKFEEGVDMLNFSMNDYRVQYVLNVACHAYYASSPLHLLDHTGVKVNNLSLTFSEDGELINAEVLK